MAVSFVEITGTLEQMGQLLAIDGMEVMIHSAAQLPGDRWRVEAYPTQAAIAAVRALGATVTVIRTEDEVTAQLDAGWAGVDEPPIA
jgi:hypothetical protein